MAPTITNTMTSLAEQYLSFRRGLGYAMRIEGAELLRFARYADESGHQGSVTVELAVRWATLPQAAKSLYRARRLDIVRRFAKHQAVFDPTTEVPPPGLLGPAYRRPPPHIYTKDELSALLQAARRLTPVAGLRPHTYATLIGLLACTGLRISEALRLTRNDVDLTAGILTIRESKFHRSRLVPLHASAVAALKAYAARRDQYHLRAASDAFFLTERGTSQKYWKTLMTFTNIRRQLGWSGRGQWGNGPRLHDLRHYPAHRIIPRPRGSFSTRARTPLTDAG